MENFIKELVFLPNKRNKKFGCNLKTESSSKQDVEIVINDNAFKVNENNFNQMIINYLQGKQKSMLTNKWLIVEKSLNNELAGVPTPKQKLEILKKEVYDKLGLPAESRSPKTIKSIFYGVFPEDARSTASWKHLKNNALNLENPESLKHIEKLGLLAKDVLNADDFDFIASKSGKKYDIVKNNNFVCLYEIA